MRKTRNNRNRNLNRNLNRNSNIIRAAKGNYYVAPAAVTPAAVTPAAVAPAAVTPAAVAPATVTPAAVTPAARAIGATGAAVVNRHGMTYNELMNLARKRGESERFRPRLRPRNFEKNVYRHTNKPYPNSTYGFRKGEWLKNKK